MIKRRTVIALLSALASWPVLRRWSTQFLEQRGLVVRNGWIVKETDL